MTSNGDVTLHPGRSLRPYVTDDRAIQLVSSLYGLKVRSLRELNSYDDRNYRVLVEDQHSNKHIVSLWPHGYVLKVLNGVDSQTNHCEAEHEVMKRLGERGFSCPQPVLNLMGAELSLESFTATPTKQQINLCHNNEQNSDEATNLHIVRLLTYVPGEMLVTVPYTTPLLCNLGQYMGAIQNALQGFAHSSLENYKTLWNLTTVKDLSDFLHVFDNREKISLISQVVQNFKDNVISKQHLFKRGAIHGDYNEQNILVESFSNQQDGVESADKVNLKEHRVCGILDFGDMSSSYYVYEVAIAIMYMMLDSSLIDPMDVGAHVLAGYLRERSLSRVELDCLPLCIAGRYAQSLVLGYYSYTLDPDNVYLLSTAKNGWTQLRDLTDISSQELLNRWDRILRTTYDMTLL